jgi:hypothetical protein
MVKASYGKRYSIEVKRDEPLAQELVSNGVLKTTFGDEHSWWRFKKYGSALL